MWLSHKLCDIDELFLLGKKVSLHTNCIFYTRISDLRVQEKAFPPGFCIKRHRELLLLTCSLQFVCLQIVNVFCNTNIFIFGLYNISFINL